MLIFISVVNDYKLYKTCIKENEFLQKNNIRIFDYDNTNNNIPIPIRYNDFLNSYNYDNEAWLCFCHCDWQPLENIQKITQSFDKNSLYGPIGFKLEFFNNKYIYIPKGHCDEKNKDGSFLRTVDELNCKTFDVDTFDCQAIFIHSSLIKKYNLRFDENLEWHLYVEDFCINAKRNYNIISYAKKIECCHWCGWHDDLTLYNQTLKYINKKYPNDIYGGTMSVIGDKRVEKATTKEILLHKLYSNIRRENG